MTGLVKKLSREKLESERCWMISDSAKSPTGELLELWLVGKRVSRNKKRDSKIQKSRQKYLSRCKKVHHIIRYSGLYKITARVCQVTARYKKMKQGTKDKLSKSSKCDQ